MTIRDDIDFFFTSPETDPSDAKRRLGPNGFGEASVLYLLRREAQGCMLDPRIPVSDAEFLMIIRTRRNCLFAFMMVVFSGIDLLAKFRSGDDKPDAGERFKFFLNKYSGVSIDDAERLYLLRNALVHSFGLFDRKAKAGMPLVDQCCNDCPENGNLISEVNGHKVVCIVHTWLAFVTGLEAYRSDLLEHLESRSGKLDTRFARMFPDYGFVRF